VQAWCWFQPAQDRIYSALTRNTFQTRIVPIIPGSHHRPPRFEAILQAADVPLSQKRNE
jgi:hypothetical protein